MARYIETKKNTWLMDALEDVDMPAILKLGREFSNGLKKKPNLMRAVYCRIRPKCRVWNVYFCINWFRYFVNCGRFVDTSVVRELNSYSPERLADLIKGKLYHDLQMIRINGSLVGAVLGGLFYVAAQLVQGGVSL